MEVKIVGSIQFKNHTLPVYGDLDEPLFKATDVADLLEYGSNNVWNLTSICEEDEKVVLPTVVAGQRRKVTFITETGLYNVLACPGVAARHSRGVDRAAEGPREEHLGAV